ADGADFGSSNEFPQGNKLGTFCGTAPHAAGNSSRAKSTTALRCVCMAWEPSSTGRSAGPCLFMDRRQGDVGAGTEQSRHCSTCPRSRWSNGVRGLDTGRDPGLVNGAEVRQSDDHLSAPGPHEIQAGGLRHHSEALTCSWSHQHHPARYSTGFLPTQSSGVSANVSLSPLILTRRSVRVEATQKIKEDHLPSAPPRVALCLPLLRGTSSRVGTPDSTISPQGASSKGHSLPCGQLVQAQNQWNLPDGIKHDVVGSRGRRGSDKIKKECQEVKLWSLPFTWSQKVMNATEPNKVVLEMSQVWARRAAGGSGARSTRSVRASFTSQEGFVQWRVQVCKLPWFTSQEGFVQWRVQVCKLPWYTSQEGFVQWRVQMCKLPWCPLHRAQTKRVPGTSMTLKSLYPFCYPSPNLLSFPAELRIGTCEEVAQAVGLEKEDEWGDGLEAESYKYYALLQSRLMFVSFQNGSMDYKFIFNKSHECPVLVSGSMWLQALADPFVLWSVLFLWKAVGCEYQMTPTPGVAQWPYRSEDTFFQQFAHLKKGGPSFEKYFEGLIKLQEVEQKFWGFEAKTCTLKAKDSRMAAALTAMNSIQKQQDYSHYQMSGAIKTAFDNMCKICLTQDTHVALKENLPGDIYGEFHKEGISQMIISFIHRVPLAWSIRVNIVYDETRPEFKKPDNNTRWKWTTMGFNPGAQNQERCKRLRIFTSIDYPLSFVEVHEAN
ncbi:hypothetical protein E2I00_006229, partial [Balaenoptera physalus]